jgi:hypothetical protein
MAKWIWPLSWAFGNCWFCELHPDRKKYFALISRSGFMEKMNKEAKAKGVILVSSSKVMVNLA